MKQKKMVKLSELEDDVLLVSECESVIEAGEVKENYMDYINNRFYIGIPREGKLYAREAVSATIDCVYENEGMYEDWDERILETFTEEDYKTIQAVFDKVLERAGSSNITYDLGELVEIDL